MFTDINRTNDRWYRADRGWQPPSRRPSKAAQYSSTILSTKFKIVARSPSKPITEYLTYLLAQANREINRQLDARFRKEGVPVEQWRILKVLSDGKSHSMGELAEAVLLNHPTLTKIVDRMVSDSLVYRVQDADDRRKVVMFSSDQGKALTQRPNSLAPQPGSLYRRKLRQQGNGGIETTSGNPDREGELSVRSARRPGECLPPLTSERIAKHRDPARALEISRDRISRSMHRACISDPPYFRDAHDRIGLYENADFSKAPHVTKLFDALKTQDFEVVIKHLQDAATVVEVYRPNAITLARRLRNDAAAIKDALVTAIAKRHPDRPYDEMLEHALVPEP